MEYKRVQIFHGPKSWNQTAEKHARAEQNLGLKSRFFNYKKLINPFRFFQIIYSTKIFNFYSAYTLLPISPNQHKRFARFAGLDIFILKFFGKKVILHFQGCEIRDRYSPHAGALCSFCEIRDQFCSPAKSKNRRKRIHQWIKIADAVSISTPDLRPYIQSENIHFIPKIFAKQEAKQSQYKMSAAEKLRVFHAPTDRSIKGTDQIVAVLTKHSDKFEMLLAENLSKNQVFEMANQADIAIDQIRVGWYGNFAVEMMALGIPVLAYIKEDLIKETGILELPIINVNESNLEQTLLNIFENRAQLLGIAEKSVNFVQHFHSEEHVAQKLINIYQNI